MTAKTLEGLLMVSLEQAVVVSIQNQREWRRLCAALPARPELADAPRSHDNTARAENRATLRREFRE